MALLRQPGWAAGCWAAVLRKEGLNSLPLPSSVFAPPSLSHDSVPNPSSATRAPLQAAHGAEGGRVPDGSGSGKEEPGGRDCGGRQKQALSGTGKSGKRRRGVRASAVASDQVRLRRVVFVRELRGSGCGLTSRMQLGMTDLYGSCGAGAGG